MNWIILVLIASLLWGVMAIIHKYCRVEYFENSLGYILFTTPVILFTLILLFFEPFIILKGIQAFLAILTGFLIFIGSYLYLEAIHKEEISRIYILLRIGPLFVLIFSTIFLTEILTLNQYIAFILMFVASMLISFKRVKKKIKYTIGALLILLSSLFFSIQTVILKFLSEVNLTTLMMYREFGYLVAVLLVFLIVPKAKKHLKKVINDLSLKQTALVYSADIIGMTGMFLFYLALQRGPVSLVAIVSTFETIFVFIFSIILSIFIPKIIKEDINRKTIGTKIVSILLMIAGLCLISV